MKWRNRLLEATTWDWRFKMNWNQILGVHWIQQWIPNFISGIFYAIRKSLICCCNYFRNNLIDKIINYIKNYHFHCFIRWTGKVLELLIKVKELFFIRVYLDLDCMYKMEVCILSIFRTLSIGHPANNNLIDYTKVLHLNLINKKRFTES